MFTSYYTTEARDGYLAASLQPYLGWSVVPRSNPGQEYPSDFSLLRLSGGGSEDKILEALQRHPLVKRVTPQRRLTRTLKFTDEGNSPSSAMVNFYCMQDATSML